MAHLFTVSTIDAFSSGSCSATEGRDYWNLDDILAEEELTPCTFKFEAKGLGYLEQLNHLSTTATTAQRKNAVLQEKDLPAGSKVDVPLWLAVSLAQRELVDLRFPKFMNKSYFGQLKAGSEVVTMR